MNTLSLSQESIRKALSHVQDPELGNDLVSLNMVKAIHIEDSHVTITIELTTPLCPLKDKIQSDCINSIRTHISPIKDITIKFTSRPIPIRNEVQLKNIQHIIPISSGKGGVGKSTIAINLARAFVEAGHSVGLLDGDIYGPNVPALLENYTPPNVEQDNKLVPVEDNGLKFVSMGLLLQPGQAVIWRGPMLHSAIKQFLSEVQWGNLEYLFIDLPPGTGDVHLSLCQMIELTGAIIVTTPQKLSVVDVRKGIGMFRQMQVDILGIIENMSYYIHPSTQEKIHVFGQDGGKALAEELNLSLFGQIPIDPKICQNTHDGLRYLTPLVEDIKRIIQEKHS